MSKQALRPKHGLYLLTSNCDSGKKHLSFAVLKIQAGSSTYLLGHSQATTKAVKLRNPDPQSDMPITKVLLVTKVSTKEGLPWLLWWVRFTRGEER